jgi:anti-sigma B factor antagonist
MTSQTEDSGNTVTLRVAGDIDHAGAESLKTAFSQLPLTGKTAVIFDFERVGYIGSAGLGKLLLFYKRLSSEYIEMRVQATTPAVRQLLRELKMDTLFPVS